MSNRGTSRQLSTRLREAADILKMTNEEISKLSKRDAAMKKLIRTKYHSLFAAIVQDYNEFSRKGYTSGARKYQKKGIDVMDNCWPQYFSGDLSAEIVMVHLNPAYDDDNNDDISDRNHFESLDEYIENCIHFGLLHHAKKGYYSKFDENLVRFFRGFKELKPLKDATNNHTRNLIRVCDDKLQLELVPYGSPEWPSIHNEPKLLQSNLDRVLEVITTHKRKYILFCGKVFMYMLSHNLYDCEEIGHKTMTEYLDKVEGGKSSYRASIVNIGLTYKGKSIKAVILPTYPRRGLNHHDYGKRFKPYCAVNNI